MYSHFWYKLIAVSSALAAAGMLTCAAAVLDILFPRGTLAAFLACMFVLGLIVVAVAAVYAWACQKNLEYFQGQLDRLLSLGSKADGRKHAITSDRATPPAPPRLSFRFHR